MTRAAVFGTGTWGTAFGMVLADAGTETTLCGRRPEIVEAINKTTTTLGTKKDIELPDALQATTDPAEALAGADLVVLAIPSQTLRDEPRSLGAAVPSGRLARQPDQGRRARHDQADERGDHRGRRGAPAERVAVVSGPNLAREIALRAAGAPASSPAPTRTVAERSADLCCHDRYFRPYTNTDVVGCELGGAVKNVIALAVGHGRRHGLRRQLEGLAHHPRAGRDRPARRRAGRRPADLLRAWPASATWSRPARRRCRATAPSASVSARA